jgi:hypothetical protein
MKVKQITRKGVEMKEESSAIEALIRDDHLLVTIPLTYLQRAAELGLTTGVSVKVTNTLDFLKYFVRKFEAIEDSSEFGRFIDNVIAEAVSDGEPFLEYEDE